MRAPLPLFPTTVVGSLPRPQYIKDLLASHARADQTSEASKTSDVLGRMDDAVRFAIGMQEQAGIEVISDGEWRRESYVDVIGEIMTGFRWVKRETFAYHQVVTEKMMPRRPGVIADEARFLREHTGRHVKVALPSPYLIGQRMWMPEHSQAAYPTREAFCEALIEPLRNELRAIRDVGVDVIQLDEPHLCVLVDEKVRAQFADPEAEMRRAVDWINQIVDGVVAEGVHPAESSGGEGLVRPLSTASGERGWG